MTNHMQTHNDHYWYELNPDTGFKFGLGKCERYPHDYPTELELTARLVVEDNPNQGDEIRTPNIMLSGGMDSELVARAFLMADLSFSVHIGQWFYRGEVVNEHDTKYAFDFCRNNDIPPIDHRIDLDPLIDGSDGDRLFEEFGIWSVRMMAQMVLMERIDRMFYGPILTGDGELCMQRNYDGWSFYHSNVGTWRSTYARARNIPLVQFLHYTPEVYASMLNTPMVYALGTDRYPGKLGANSSKIHAMRFWFPDMESRPCLHGFESIDEKIIEKNASFVFKPGFVDRGVYVPFWKMWENLYGDLMDLDKQPYYPPHRMSDTEFGG